MVWQVEEEGKDTRLEVEQGPGEVVFVPSGWHHQVVNLEDTISINHNWFNGSNIHQVLVLLEQELGKVEAEISDCMGEDWPRMCQDLLKASYGMNLDDLVSLLSCVLERRLRTQEDDVFKVTFDQEVLGPNHARFDIQEIFKVLQKLVILCQGKLLDVLCDKCAEMLSKCNKYL